MSTGLQTITAALAPTSPETLDKLAVVQKQLLGFEQIPIATEHILHGGMYARTIRMKPGTVLTGSLIKLATMVIINGSTAVFVGDGWAELDGYNVLPASAGRKQLFVTRGTVEVTMIFPTQAQTIEEAEDEVFAEADLLISRRDGGNDTITITGE